MTQDFSQPAFPVNLSGTPRDATPQDPPSPIRWRTFALPKDDEDVKAYGADNVLGWELRIDDLRNGFLQYGDFARGGTGVQGGSAYEGDYRSVSSSTLNTLHRRHFLLPFLTSQTSLAGASTPAGPVSSANVFNTLAMAFGNVANRALYAETSATDPTPVAKTYTPGGYINALSAIVYNWNTTKTERLAVMRTGASWQGLSDLAATPTVDGTGHANLSPTWGVGQSPVNATTPGSGVNCWYANNGLWTTQITDAIGAAPVQVLSNLPNGGCYLGMDRLDRGDLSLRFFWWIPDVDTSTPALVNRGKVMHTDLEGADPQWIPTRLATTSFACLWEHKVVMTDTVSIETFDGEDSVDLQWMKGRAGNTDMVRRVQSFAVASGVLMVVGAQSDGANNASPTSANLVLQLEQYVSAFGSWVPYSGSLPLGEQAVFALAPFSPIVFGTETGSPILPWSKQTQFLHIPTRLYTGTTTKWDRIFRPPPGQNPFDIYRQTGASAGYSQAFETTGTVTTPYFELPQLEGRWKKADQIVFLGDVDAGGTGSTVLISLNGSSGITFGTGLTDGARVAQTSETGDDALFMQLQIAETITRGSTTTKTPNGGPFLIRGRAYLVDPTSESDSIGNGI